MAGTKAGGIKARETNYAKHGADFYREIGAKGGRNGTTGGFYANPALASIAGAMGGRMSRRGKQADRYPRVPSELSDEDWRKVERIKETNSWDYTAEYFGINPGSIVGGYKKWLERRNAAIY